MACPSGNMVMDLGATGKWKLHTVVVVLLSVWVAAFVALALAALVRHAQSEAGDHFLPGAALRLAAMLVAGMGASGYIYVSATAPRPAQLHRNGLLTILMLPELGCWIVSRLLAHELLLVESYAFSALAYCIRPFIVTLFIRLVVQKTCSLGPHAGPFTNLALWANLLIAVTFLGAFGGLVPVAVCRSYIQTTVETFPMRSLSQIDDFMGGPPGRSTTVEDNETALGNETDVRVRNGGGAAVEASVCEDLIDTGEVIVQVSLVLLAVMYIIAMAVLRRYVSIAFARLVNRDVTDEQLSKVRKIVLRHNMGMLSGFLADLSFIVATIVDLQNFLNNEEADDLMTSVAHLIDALGDTIGVLLLSGVGVLLLGRDSPDVGDVSGKLRGLMHAAVLTSRADTVFEGRVAKTSSLRCVASFPGKYVREWNALTWLCEQGDLSCACVFLPGSDPQQRFGRHFECPETPGQCWCHSLYGCVQPWGCMWFEAWRKNIEAAVTLGLELVVVYFPGQVGQGRVLWEDLGTSDLWNGQGLGGSQKAEVAYLRNKGIDFLEEDIRSFRRTITMAGETFRKTLSRNMTPTHATPS